MRGTPRPVVLIFGGVQEEDDEKNQVNESARSTLLLQFEQNQTRGNL